MNLTKITTTVPDSILSRLEALTKATGQTRSAVLQMIIPAGLKEIESTYGLNTEAQESLLLSVFSKMGLTKELFESFQDDVDSVLGIENK